MNILSEHEIKYIKNFIRREHILKVVICAVCVVLGLLLVILTGVMVESFNILSVIGIIGAVFGILGIIYFRVTDCGALEALDQGNYLVKAAIVSDKYRDIVKMNYRTFRTVYYVRCNNIKKAIYLLEGKRAYNRLQIGDSVKIVEFSYMKKMIKLVI